MDQEKILHQVGRVERPLNILQLLRKRETGGLKPAAFRTGIATAIIAYGPDPYNPEQDNIVFDFEKRAYKLPSSVPYVPEDGTSVLCERLCVGREFHHWRCRELQKLHSEQRLVTINKAQGGYNIIEDQAPVEFHWTEGCSRTLANTQFSKEYPGPILQTVVVDNRIWYPHSKDAEVLSVIRRRFSSNHPSVAFSLTAEIDWYRLSDYTDFLGVDYDEVGIVAVATAYFNGNHRKVSQYLKEKLFLYTPIEELDFDSFPSSKIFSPTYTPAGLAPNRNTTFCALHLLALYQQARANRTELLIDPSDVPGVNYTRFDNILEELREYHRNWLRLKVKSRTHPDSENFINQITAGGQWLEDLLDEPPDPIQEGEKSGEEWTTLFLGWDLPLNGLETEYYNIFEKFTVSPTGINLRVPSEDIFPPRAILLQQRRQVGRYVPEGSTDSM